MPRLFGFTLSPPRGSGLFKNTLAKSALFRPYRGLGAGQDYDPVYDFLPLVDASGGFIGPWKRWFAEQRRLNDQYEKLEEGAGRIFTIEDVAVCKDSGACPGRRQPTAAEFMAHITVEVATHLDLAAESRTRPRGKARPDADEFVPDEYNVPGNRESSGLVVPDEEGAGEKDVDVDADGDVGKPTRYMYELEDGAVQEVAFHEGIGVAPATKRYRDAFLTGFAKSQNPRWLNVRKRDKDTNRSLLWTRQVLTARVSHRKRHSKTTM